MPDKEKAIRGLECLITDEFPCNGCPYEEQGYCPSSIARDALELLKEQEYARCLNCQFRDFGENEVDSWDRCKLHRHNTSPDEYCLWFVERAGDVDGKDD